MAVRFDAAADRLLRTSDLLSYNSDYTICAWIYLVTDLNANTVIFGTSDNTTNNNDILGLNSDGTTLICAAAVGGANSTGTGTNLSTGTWYHLAFVRSGDDIFAYLNGVQDATANRSISGRTANTRWEFGALLSINILRFDGRLYAIKAWSGVKTAAQLRNEMELVVPQSLDNIYGWWPCMAGATERLADYGGSARNFTAGGTLTDEAAPPIAWDHVPTFSFLFGGTTFQQALTAGLTPGGALVKAPLKVVAGGLTPGGLLVKTPGKVLAGSVTPSAAIVRIPGKVLAGSVTPSAAIVRIPGKVLAGSVTPSAALVKQPEKIVAGTVTPNGAVFKSTSKVVSAGLTPSGALAAIRTIIVQLAASLTPGGTLARTISKTLTGAVTPAAGLIKQTARALAAGLTPSAATVAALVQTGVSILSVTGGGDAATWSTLGGDALARTASGSESAAGSSGSDTAGYGAAGGDAGTYSTSGSDEPGA